MYYDTIGVFTSLSRALYHHSSSPVTQTTLPFLFRQQRRLNINLTCSLNLPFPLAPTRLQNCMFFLLSHFSLRFLSSHRSRHTNRRLRRINRTPLIRIHTSICILKVKRVFRVSTSIARNKHGKLLASLFVVSWHVSCGSGPLLMLLLQYLWRLN